MLILTRRIDEAIIIGDDIEIKVLEIDNSAQVKLGLEAPDDVVIVREELLGKD